MMDYSSDNRYILMNKDRPVAKLSVNRDIVRISEIINEVPSYLYDIQSWISSRTSIISRDNLYKLAKLAGISNEYEFLTVSRALSINDTFWVNDLFNSTTWDKVNPYTNRISKIMADIAINGIDKYGNQNLKSPSPQYRVDGSVDKCVKRENGELYLYKTDGEKCSDLAGCRPYSEYYCSQLEKILGLSNFVDYKVKVNITENGYYKPYTYSKVFTNEKHGLVHMCDSKFARYTLPELDKMMPTKMRIQLREMALLDSLTLNFDRHSGNYGFIVDNDTYRILGLAPIYDNDCALGSMTSIQNKSFDEAYYEIMTTRMPKLELGDYNQMARWALTRDLVNKLEGVDTIKFDRLPGLSERRVQFIEYIVNRRRKEIMDMINTK